MKRKNQSQDDFKSLSHELAQPLMVINTYLIGCLQRLKDNNITNEQMQLIINKLLEQTNLISEIAQRDI